MGKQTGGQSGTGADRWMRHSSASKAKRGAVPRLSAAYIVDGDEIDRTKIKLIWFLFCSITVFNILL